MQFTKAVCTAAVLTLLMLVALAFPMHAQAQGVDPAVLQSPLLRGLKHWWRAVPGLTHGAQLYDLTLSRNHGTLTNMGFSSTSGWNITDRPGGVAHIAFDGTNDYVTTAQNAGVTQTTPLTLCAWVWMQAAPAAGQMDIVVGTQLVVSPTDGVFLAVGDVLKPFFLMFGTNGTTQLNINATNAIPLKTWTHVCGSMDGTITTAGLGLYVNGEVAPATPQIFGTGLTINDHPWNLGANVNGGTPDSFLGGNLDDVMVFWRALDPGEVRALYQASQTGYTTLQSTPDQFVGPLPLEVGGAVPLWQQTTVPNLQHPLLAGLLNWWRAVPGRTGGDRFFDLVGGFHGTLVNYGATLGWSPAERPGGAAQLNFNGSNTYVTVGAGSDFQFANTTFTVMGWARARNCSPNACYLVAKREVGVGAWFIRVDAAGTLSGTTTSASNVSAQRATQTTTWADDTWRHFAVVVTTDTITNGNNTITLYTNGALDQGALTNIDGYAVPTVPLTFGMHSDGVSGPLTGALDDIKFFGRGLAPGEIQALYQLSLVGDAELFRPERPDALGAPAAAVAAGPKGTFLPFFR
jgi:hypothetical protein